MKQKNLKVNFRYLEEKVFKILMIGAIVVVLGSLGAIVGIVCYKGIPALSVQMLTQPPQAGYYLGGGGGILNAILGSLYLGLGATVLATVMSLGLVIFLNVYLKNNSKLAMSIRFLMDVLWGIPSVVYGAFAFSLMAVLGWPSSLLAGILTVAVVILPMMTRAIDAVFKMIPIELREASLSLGSTSFEMASKVLLKQAVPGIITAILITFGRGMSDAAAVLFTSGYTDALPYSLMKPVATLPLAVFFQIGTPFPDVQARGYAAAFVLTMMVLMINVAARLISRRWSKFTIK